jgi:hypothetical protein
MNLQSAAVVFPILGTAAGTTGMILVRGFTVARAIDSLSMTIDSIYYYVMNQLSGDSSDGREHNPQCLIDTT